MSSSGDYVNLSITSNLNSFPTQRRFPSSITLKSLKEKLELLTGASAPTMELHLKRNEEEKGVLLSDPSLTLAEAGVGDGMSVHVIDKNSGNEEDEGAKFELSEDDYAKREESARLFLMRNKLGKYDEEKAKKLREEEERETELSKSLEVGRRCEVTVPGAPVRRGAVRFVGGVEFKPGDWVGIEYDEPVGKNDGSINGKVYFECKAKYGGFVRPSAVKLGDFPELGLEELDEI